MSHYCIDNYYLSALVFLHTQVFFTTTIAHRLFSMGDSTGTERSTILFAIIPSWSHTLPYHYPILLILFSIPYSPLFFPFFSLSPPPILKLQQTKRDETGNWKIQKIIANCQKCPTSDNELNLMPSTLSGENWKSPWLTTVQADSFHNGL